MAHGLKFPYIHDLGRLLTLLVQAGVRVPIGPQKSKATR